MIVSYRYQYGESPISEQQPLVIRMIARIENIQQGVFYKQEGALLVCGKCYSFLNHCEFCGVADFISVSASVNVGTTKTGMR